MEKEKCLPQDRKMCFFKWMEEKEPYILLLLWHGWDKPVPDGQKWVAICVVGAQKQTCWSCPLSTHNTTSSNLEFCLPRHPNVYTPNVQSRKKKAQIGRNLCIGMLASGLFCRWDLEQVDSRYGDPVGQPETIWIPYLNKWLLRKRGFNKYRRLCKKLTLDLWGYVVLFIAFPFFWKKQTNKL